MSEDHPIVEHKPSVGRMYDSALNGQRIAIVAYSHHYDEPKHEDANFTKSVIAEVMLDKRHKASWLFKNTLTRPTTRAFGIG
jgi:hypothetical protein